MDFTLTEEQQLIKQNAREFAEQYCAPIAAEIDRNGRYPAETVQELAAHDFMGMPYPEEWGGAGSDQAIFWLSKNYPVYAHRPASFIPRIALGVMASI